MRTLLEADGGSVVIRFSLNHLLTPVVLERSIDDPMQNFFLQGGDSIAAMRMLQLLHERYAWSCNIQEFMNNPSVLFLKQKWDECIRSSI
jgi:hypothetical protein